MALNQTSQLCGRFRFLHSCSRCNIFCFRKNDFSWTKVLDKGLTKEPIKYSQTKASKMAVEEILFPDKKSAALPIERYVVIGSLLVFATYFFYLREENKIDEILGGTFNFEGDEEIKLVNAIIHARINGFKTDDLEEKLQKIRSQK